MGKFVYDSNFSADIEDRALAHLQVVILSKVRRGEAFAFTWKDPISTGGGRTSVYIHGRSVISFKYTAVRTPQLNPAWLNLLNSVANSGRGLYLAEEPTMESSVAAEAAEPRNVSAAPAR